MDSQPTTEVKEDDPKEDVVPLPRRKFTPIVLGENGNVLFGDPEEGLPLV
jgi:hypothetical protein